MENSNLHIYECPVCGKRQQFNFKSLLAKECSDCFHNKPRKFSILTLCSLYQCPQCGEQSYHLKKEGQEYICSNDESLLICKD